jgi:thioredoxin reductase (NADPH)
MDEKIYDLIIIGTGPAGYTASIYSSRYKIEHLLIGEMPGGLMSTSHKICNYPSETEISGFDLLMKMENSVKFLGVNPIMNKVIDVNKKDNLFEITLSGDKKYLAKTLLLSIGTTRRKLNVKGEIEFLGKGVSYCSTCDAMFFKNKRVAVVGGGDAATTAALYLSNIAESVHQIYRGSELKGEVAWIDQVKNNPKVKVVFNTNVIELKGEGRLQKAILDNEIDGKKELDIDGVFIEIGSVPDEMLMQKIGVSVDKAGYIEVKADQKTNIDNVWAAGDITTNSNKFKQVITACSEGAVAAEAIFEYLQKSK